MCAKAVQVVPSASRLIFSLRDLGYDFPTAVAELVDNSIEARATNMDIVVEFRGGDSWVLVADNGHGMSPEVLREAMRFGTERDYDEHSLGKFGLGLKTSSISQCRSLTVTSRTSKSRAAITAYSWDIDHVRETNRWEILPRTGNQIRPEVRQALADRPGTVVLWERLDRMFDYQNPEGTMAQRGLANMCRELEEHLAMVFHRFLSGENRGRKLSIVLNGNKVKPWDPFARDETDTNPRETRGFPVSQDGISGEVLISPYILPHKVDFSTPEAFRAAAGPKKWNRQQGLYVYREDRMIQSGGWTNLRTIDEHTKLARITMDFENSMDGVFKTNVAKMKIQIPSTLRDELKGFIDPIVMDARKVYDRREKKGTVPNPATKKWTLSQVERMLKKLADQEEKSILAKLFRLLKKDLKGT